MPQYEIISFSRNSFCLVHSSKTSQFHSIYVIFLSNSRLMPTFYNLDVVLLRFWNFCWQFFYRPDALPTAQPTASKHWRNTQVLRYSTHERLFRDECFLPINCTDTVKKHHQNQQLSARPTVYALRTSAVKNTAQKSLIIFSCILQTIRVLIVCCQGED